MGYMTWDGETIRVHMNVHDPYLVDWDAASACIGGVAIHNPPAAPPVAVSPSSMVRPRSGVRGTEFEQVGRGLTPNGDVTLHFRYPNGASATLDDRAAGDGSTYNYWTAPADAQIGGYAFWVVDDRTGTSSPETPFWITADCLPSPEVCNDGVDNDCDGDADGDDSDCPACGDGTCDESESYFDCRVDCSAECSREPSSLIRDGSFESGLRCWIREDHHAAAVFRTHDGAASEPPTARLDVSDAGEIYEVQLAQKGIPVVAGNSYRLRFSAKASPRRDILVQAGRASEPYDGFGLYATRTIGTG